MPVPALISTPLQSHSTRNAWGRRLWVLPAVVTVFALVAPNSMASTQTKPAPAGEIAKADDCATMVPAAPKKQPAPVPMLDDDLLVVPQISFQEPFAWNIPSAEWKQKMLQQISKIDKLNQKETDGFWKALQTQRADLAGMPVLMGGACRMPQEELLPFAAGLTVLRSTMKKSGVHDNPQGCQDGQAFWDMYKQMAGKIKGLLTKKGPTDALEARGQVAGLMQVLATEPPVIREGLVRFLAGMPHPAATRALGQLAVFSPEESVRAVAIRALQDRPAQDYTDILLAALSYPWPTVAGRAAEAIVQLGRADLVPTLVDRLGDADPRLPVAMKLGGKQVFEVQQLVKLNHHQNCLLCHPSGDGAPNGAITAPIPDPSQPLPSFMSGYGKSKPSPGDIIVRVDMTYLRQDFSLLQPVVNPGPWPKQQRFDFLVRKVPLTAAQAKMFQSTLQHAAGANTPYQDALLVALRGLTGQDAAATPQAWRKVLHLPG